MKSVEGDVNDENDIKSEESDDATIVGSLAVNIEDSFDEDVKAQLCAEEDGNIQEVWLRKEERAMVKLSERVERQKS